MKKKTQTEPTNAAIDIIQGHLTIFRCHWLVANGISGGEKKKKASQTKCKEKGEKKV